MALTDRGRVLAARAQGVPITWLTKHVFERNAVCRLGLLRRHPALVQVFRGRLGVAATRDEVERVLADDTTFHAGYTARLPGPFVLGLEGGPHERVRGELAQVIRPADLAGIARRTDEQARSAVDSADGALDVGADLVRPIFDDTVSTYLGITGSDPATRWLWGRDIFEHIFLNLADAPALRANADVATAQLTELIGARVDELRRTPSDRHVLGRLVARDVLDPGEISVNLIGLAVGWWWHGARTALIAVDEILDDPSTIRQAREAAVAGDGQLQRLVWDVLRRRPVQLGVLRTCTRDTTVSGQQVRRGSTVLVGTQAATADGADLIFGAGLHRCMGEAIMKAQLPALLRPLLSRPGLRRVGPMRWDGPRPDGITVRW